jgi:flagellar hook-associated protein 3 FlgL
MRIASNQYHATMNSALQSANSGLSQVMQQMAAGKRVMKPSDDTIATVRLARLTREEAALSQYRDNIGALKTRLQTNEVTLDSMEQDMMMARDLLVWAADGGNTTDDIAAMAGSLEALRDSLFYSANSRNAEGKYLFSGTASNIDTVIDMGAGVTPRYVAGAGTNDQTQDVAVGDGVSIAANITLGQFDIAGFLSKLDQTAQAFKDGSYTGTTARDQLLETDRMLKAVSSQIGVLGGRQNVIQTLDDSHGTVSLANQQSAIDLGQLDYAEAAVRLNSYTLAVQATQKAYAKVSGLSLFNAF